MVRLDVTVVQLSELPLYTFQFLNGAIGCRQTMPSRLPLLDFNSLMVRLDDNFWDKINFWNLISIP